jgi:hypothetical protein
MHSKLSKLMLAAVLASTVIGSSYAPAQAGGRDVAAGVLGGLLLGGLIASQRPYYAAPPGPGYVAPAPVYVQPRVCYRREKYFDPYSGWGWRQVQYYC